MAGGGKESPRQKMIGMMYLVLTALLAMNVSKDILMTFITVNESLERSNKNFTKSTEKIMEGFQAAAVSFVVCWVWLPTREKTRRQRDLRRGENS